MADSVSITGQGAPARSPQQTGTNRGPVLESRPVLDEPPLIPVEGLSPNQASSLQSFYNMTLMNIYAVRGPQLPSLTQKNSQAAPGEPQRQYYHDSPEEKKLKLQLEHARQSKNRGEIQKAHDELTAYWKKIIDEDYGSSSKEDLPEKLEEVRSLYRKDPRDPLTGHKLSALEARVRKLRDDELLEAIENIKNGDLKESSPTGQRLAKIAKKHAKGDGHHCYKYVADDLSRIGIYLEGLSAYQAADQLAESDKVREIINMKPEDLKNLPAGAIVVWDKCKGHRHGHISISLGNGKEASDVIRNQLTKYGPRFRVFVPEDM